MKKILIISKFFYPVNNPRSFRTSELAIELAKQGHDVTVLTPKLEIHNEFELKHNLSIVDIGEPKWKTPELKGNTLAILLKRFLRRAAQLFLYYPNLEFYFLVRKALKKQLKVKEEKNFALR